MLYHKIKPHTDSLGVFPALLSLLKNIRMEAKEASRNAKSHEDKNRLEALQLTYKVLINSFYGYLGYTYGLFNDMSQAAKVTEVGREVLTKMINLITQYGGMIMEADTDGIYFVPPRGLIERRARDIRKGISERDA